MNREASNLLRTLYNALRDRPLDPGDPLYVPFLENRASETNADPVLELATHITWAESASVHLLTGQRGSGKSTELRRLRATLEGDDCTVFLCDMRDYMNLTTPVEITDFLVAVMAALSEAIKDHVGRDPMGRGYLERVTDWLGSEVALGDLALKGGPVTIKASLKDDPSFKQRLQAGLEGHVAALKQQAQGFAEEAVELVRDDAGDPDRKVVLLVDSVEQIRGVGADGAEVVYRSVENMFSGHADALSFPMLHVVYTVPPYLVPLAPGIGRQLGGGMVHSLPSVHVQARGGSADPEGVSIMRDILARRSERWAEIFTPAQVERLALSSGGDIRDFFRLLREAVVRARNTPDAALPMADAVVAAAAAHLRREMLPIAEEDKGWLREIAETKAAMLPNMAELHQLARFFDTNLVLNYRNGDDWYWYDVHPLLKEAIRV